MQAGTKQNKQQDKKLSVGHLLIRFDQCFQFTPFFFNFILSEDQWVSYKVTGVKIKPALQVEGYKGVIKSHVEFKKKKNNPGKRD